MTGEVTDAATRNAIVAAASTVAVGAVVLVLALTDNAALIPVWLGFAGVGGMTTAIKGQLTQVARTVGTQQLENGDSLASLESYTHEQMHAIKNSLTAIAGALVITGIMTREQMAKMSEPPAVDPPPPAVSS